EEVDRRVQELIGGAADAAVATGAIVAGNLLLAGGAIGGALLATPPGLALAAGTIGGVAWLQRAGVLPDADELAAWAAERVGPIIANPATVTVLRALVGGGDEIANAVLGTVALVPGAAPLVAGMVPFGGFRSLSEVASALTGALERAQGPSSFRMREHELPPRPAPASVEGLVRTIPPSRVDEPQVEITRYERPDGTVVHLVSIAGTGSLEFGGDWAMDNKANAHAYAGLSEEELRETVLAVADAMAAAGIDDGDEVVLAGYSLGALIVAGLAGSGRWEVPSALLVGSPVHGNELPDGTVAVQLDHDDDPITALQGHHQLPRGDLSIVTGTPHPDGLPLGGGVFDGHAQELYADTAAAYDRLPEALHADHRRELLAPLAGATAVTTTQVTIHRVDPAAVDTARGVDRPAPPPAPTPPLAPPAPPMAPVEPAPPLDDAPPAPVPQSPGEAGPSQPERPIAAPPRFEPSPAPGIRAPLAPPTPEVLEQLGGP
ncbi:MAG: hypothetical protein GXX90_01615, partial [Microbacteriaceae bacterium]|nr:hypothetical protein [Microbacteriaceae bacterium]